MTRLVGLLRAVNVGGTGKLPMADLRAMCDACGFRSVRTYIASGNVVFDWDGGAAAAKAILEAALRDYAGKKPVAVMIRDADEMDAVVGNNPFADAPGNKVVAMFLDDAPPANAAADARNLNDEQIALGTREIYVHYVSGQGRSRLVIPAAASGTARNMNTVAKLADMAKGGGDGR